MQEFDFKEVLEATESFSQARFIGKGSHGIVYKGILKNGQTIAVKKQSLGLQKLQDNSKLENEIQILTSIGSKNSPHLIKLLGISHDFDFNKVIVLEYMDNGTLDELLHNNADSVSFLDWHKRGEIAVQIAKGVEFLHEKTGDCCIVHRDIKSANVLFDSDWNAKLCDFGLAVKMDDDELQMQNGEKFAGLRNRPAGTIGYLDPCYTVPGKLSTKIDVFSFGVLLLEIISGKKVMDFSRSPASIVDWAIPLIGKHLSLEICDKRIRVPRFMEGMIRNMLSIASRCLLSIESNRPSMKEVVTELQSCRRTYVEEPVRFPAWMNLLPCSLLLLKSGQRKLINDLKRGNADEDEDHLPNRKMTLWDILADVS